MHWQNFTKTTSKKVDGRDEQKVSRRRYANGQKASEKNVLCHLSLGRYKSKQQGNISVQQGGWNIPQKVKLASVSMDVGRTAQQNTSLL